MTKEYTLQLSEHGDVLSCESCGCEVPTRDFEGKQPLCEFCATTLTSNYTQYDHRGDMFAALRQEIWKAAACVVNHLNKKEQ